MESEATGDMLGWLELACSMEEEVGGWGTGSWLEAKVKEEGGTLLPSLRLLLDPPARDAPRELDLHANTQILH
jgi:hypothetical protein